MISREESIIYDCYKLNNEEIIGEVDKIMAARNRLEFGVKRSRKSYVRETVAHRRMYKLWLFRKHTKDCNLEENIKSWVEIVYNVIGYNKNI